MVNILKISGIIVAIFISLFAIVSIVNGAVSYAVQTKVDSYETFDFFLATTTSATSTNLTNNGGYFLIAGAKKVTFYFTHGGVATTSTATSTFKIQTTKDGTTWNDYYKLTSATSSAIQQTIGIVDATSTVVTEMSNILTNSFLGVRCIVTEGTTGQAGGSGDGEHTCIGAATF